MSKAKGETYDALMAIQGIDARAGMIYLSLGMHREENRRRKAKGDTIVAPMNLDLWEDKWKR
jgi:hypothetical protein